MPWPRVPLCVCQSVISGCSIQTLTDRAGVLARSLSSTCPTQFGKEIQCRNNDTFSGTVFQTPKYRLIYLLQSAVCVDIDGIFTRTLKLCWHCRADNDWLSRCRRKHLESQWVRPQQMLLLLLLPKKLLHLQVDILWTHLMNLGFVLRPYHIIINCTFHRTSHTCYQLGFLLRE